MPEDSMENPPLRARRHRAVTYLALVSIVAALAAVYFLRPAPEPSNYETPSSELAPIESAQPKLPVASYAVTRADGKKIPLALEEASTLPQQEKGLMFRTQMEADEGMIFLYTDADIRQIWMKNTVLPLDIIFIGADHRILSIEPNSTPFSETVIASPSPAQWIVELRGGVANAYGLHVGDLISKQTPSPETTDE